MEDCLSLISLLLEPENFLNAKRVCKLWSRAFSKKNMAIQIVKFNGVEPDFYSKVGIKCLPPIRNKIPKRVVDLYMKNKKSLFCYAVSICVADMQNMMWKYVSGRCFCYIDCPFDGWVMFTTRNNVMNLKTTGSSFSLAIMTYLMYKKPGLCIEDKLALRLNYDVVAI